jgi:hypothetical protein
MNSILLLVALLPTYAAAAAPPKKPPAAAVSAEEILRRSDRARGGLAGGLAWTIKLENAGQAAAEYEIKAKGLNVIAKCTAPARQKGETFLFNDRNLWIHKPGLKKPVSLSPRQRLSGQAANGDIATTNYARDYSARIEAEETLKGKKVYRLFLEAKEKNVTYDKIRYWVSKDTFLGMKAEFLTLEGKPFKVAAFQYFHTLKGLPFVSRMDIQDAKNPKDRTALYYSSPRPEAMADGIFNVNNLSR